MSASLDIIIVNWYSGRQLKECLESIAATDRDGFVLSRVVVVDNASRDGSSDGLVFLGLPLYIIRNGENFGFGHACNQGAKGSEADYLLFLNPDTRLFKKSLRDSMFFIKQYENSHIGILGVQLVNGDGNVSKTCARFPKPSQIFSKIIGLNRLFPRVFPDHFMVEWDHKESREVDQVMGAFFLVRRSLFEELAGFDERFFVYYEEVDFSYRARQQGWQSFYLVDAQVYHKGGGTSEQVKDKRLFYSLRSRILYGYKHFNWFSASALMLGTLLLEPVSRVVLGVIHRSWKEISETLKGYALLWSEMPTLLKTLSRRDKL